MAYSTLSLDKETLEKVNRLYNLMNQPGIFRSKSSFVELLADFFLESSENRKALWKFWLEKNPELRNLLMVLLQGNGSAGKNIQESKADTTDFEKSLQEELKEVVEGFDGLEDKEL